MEYRHMGTAHMSEANQQGHAEEHRQSLLERITNAGPAWISASLIDLQLFDDNPDGTLEVAGIVNAECH